MPMYDYQCTECNYEYEELRKMEDRALARVCPSCKNAFTLKKVSAPRIDPNMDCPGAKMKFRKDAERRGRGADMTRANREDTSEDTHREAWNRRQAMGETRVTKH